MAQPATARRGSSPPAPSERGRRRPRFPRVPSPVADRRRARSSSASTVALAPVCTVNSILPAGAGREGSSPSLYTILRLAQEILTAWATLILWYKAPASRPNRFATHCWAAPRGTYRSHAHAPTSSSNVVLWPSTRRPRPATFAIPASRRSRASASARPSARTSTSTSPAKRSWSSWRESAH